MATFDNWYVVIYILIATFFFNIYNLNHFKLGFVKTKPRKIDPYFHDYTMNIGKFLTFKVKFRSFRISKPLILSWWPVSLFYFTHLQYSILRCLFDFYSFWQVAEGRKSSRVNGSLLLCGFKIDLNCLGLLA
jgi:hypothetical protein